MSVIAIPYKRVRSAKHGRTCQNEKCGKPFLTYYADAKYCSRACRESTWRKNAPTLITAERVRKEDGIKLRVEPPARHVCDENCVRKDYGSGTPVCFRAYFQAQNDHRKGTYATDERTREGARAEARG